MLSLTQNQLESISNHKQEHFIRQIINYIKKSQKLTIDQEKESKLEALLEELINKARSYHYYKQHEIFYFIEISLMLGENFDTKKENEWLITILTKNKKNNTTSAKELFHIVYEKHFKSNNKVI